MDEGSINSLSQNKILIAEIHENLPGVECEFPFINDKPR